MQVYGFLEKAQLENVSSDLAQTLLGLMWFNTSDSSFRYYDGAVRTVVSEDGAQTLTNKTITGAAISGGTITGAAISSGTIDAAAITNGTIDAAAITNGTITGAAISGGSVSGTTISTSNINNSDINLGIASDSNKIVVSSDTKANLDILTKESGSVYYATDEEKYYGDNGVDLINLADPFSFTTVTKTTTATLLTSGEDNVLVDATAGDFTVTLPTAVGNNGITYKISKLQDANLVTIDGDGTETIGGDLTIVMSSSNDSIIIASDGSNWIILSNDISYAARYTSNAGQTVSNGSNFVYEDGTRDTHNAYNAGTGEYTVPATGWYDIKASVRPSTAVTVSIAIEVDSTQVSATLASDSTQAVSCVIDDNIYLVKDEVVTIVNNSGSSRTLNAFSVNNVFSIIRNK